MDVLLLTHRGKVTMMVDFFGSARLDMSWATY